jgi:hypothetical protein
LEAAGCEPLGEVRSPFMESINRLKRSICSVSLWVWWDLRAQGRNGFGLWVEMTWARLKEVLIRVNSGVLGSVVLEILFVLSIVNGPFILNNAKCTLTAHSGSMGRP